jgi:hypothetical protein
VRLRSAATKRPRSKTPAWRRALDLVRFVFGIGRFALEAARLMLLSRLAVTVGRRAAASDRYRALGRPPFPLQPVQQSEDALPLGVERQ